MAHAVFIHRPDTKYDDMPSDRYQFPKQYLGRVRRCEGDWIVYLEPSKVPGTRGYFAAARVQRIAPDDRHAGMFLAIIARGSFLEFGDPVPFRDGNEPIERGLLNAAGRVSGRAQAAVRSLDRADFLRIAERGLVAGETAEHDPAEVPGPDGFAEAQDMFLAPPERQRMTFLTNRTVRDRNFRKTVLRAYDLRCGITGRRFVNGGGAAEVEAAHIQPVEEGGPDLAGNGIALSRTVHWMFDRGVLGLSEDLDILVSRHTNDVEGVRSLINDTGRLLPTRRPGDGPRAAYVTWHRTHRFKH